MRKEFSLSKFTVSVLIIFETKTISSVSLNYFWNKNYFQYHFWNKNHFQCQLSISFETRIIFDQLLLFLKHESFSMSTFNYFWNKNHFQCQLLIIFETRTISNANFQLFLKQESFSMSTFNYFWNKNHFQCQLSIIFETRIIFNVNF